MSIKAVIFDRDNTLAQVERATLAGITARIQAAAPGLSMDVVNDQWLAWAGPWPLHEDEEPQFWQAFWSHIATLRAGQTTDLAALCAIGPLYNRMLTPFPDARACLDQLHARGLRLAVLTNFQLPGVRSSLEMCGLDPALFDVLLSSSGIGVAKPDPRAYRHAAEALGLAPEECLFVDDLVENVVGACSVGMRGVLLNRDGADLGHDGESICGLAHLIDLIDAGLAASSLGAADERVAKQPA